MSLADRMKEYEQAICGQKALPQLPVAIRLDGKAFHSYTRGMKKPYDEVFCHLMAQVTANLVEETNACIGYTQSDEISLIFYSDNYKSQIFFDGKFHKLNSVCASMCTLFFEKLKPWTNKGPAYFDCRSWMLPTKEEVANYLTWRERDATKNSILCAGQSVFSHKALHNLNTSQVQDKLFNEKGINWNDYPAFFKRGTYVQRKKVETKFSTEELDRLPEKHDAKSNPDLTILRNIVVPIDMPPISKVNNIIDVIFSGKYPETDEKD